jgi:hypothetical protein
MRRKDMALPEFTRKLIEKKLDQYGDQRVPEHPESWIIIPQAMRRNNPMTPPFPYSILPE